MVGLERDKNMASRVNLKMTGDDFKGIKNLKENLAKLRDTKAKVGVFGGRHPGSGESIPDIAMLHEFGSQTARSFSYKGSIIKIKGIPTRSFLRMPLRVKKLKVVGDKEYMKKYVMYALQTGHVNVPLEIMGHQAEAVIQDAFDSQGFGQWDKNMSKAYIAAKGSDTPLIDTGFLRQSVTSKVGKA